MPKEMRKLIKALEEINKTNEKEIKMNKLIIIYDIDKKDENKRNDLEKFLRNDVFNEWIHLQGSSWVGDSKYTLESIFKSLEGRCKKSKFSVSKIDNKSIFYHNGRLDDKEDEKNASKKGDVIFPKT